MIKILAMKLGEVVGLAIGSSSRHVVSCTWRFPYGEEAAALTRQLVRLHYFFGPAAIYIEEAPATNPKRPRGLSARAALVAQLRQAVEVHAEARAVPITAVKVRHHRKLWTGNGNGGGQLVLAYAQARLLFVGSAEEADAISLFHWAATRDTPDSAITGLVAPRFKVSAREGLLWARKLSAIRRIQRMEAPEGPQTPWRERRPFYPDPKK